MSMRTAVVATTTLLLLGSGLTSTPAESAESGRARILHARYVLGAGAGGVDAETGQQFGRVIFRTLRTDRFVLVRIVDATRDDTYASLDQDTDGDGDVDRKTYFCGSSGPGRRLARPGTALAVTVYEGPCLPPGFDGGATAAATTGTVYVGFSAVRPITLVMGPNGGYRVFSPNPLRVPAGSDVLWSSRDHPLMSYTPNWRFSSSAGARLARYRFTRPGTYGYLCQLHGHLDDEGECRGMCGTVVVTR